MKPLFWIICIGTFGLAGCGLREQTGEEPAVPVSSQRPLESSSGDLAHAHLLFHQGQYQQAFIEYRQVMDGPFTWPERQQGRLGVAQCLIKSGAHAAALVTLNPLPLPPRSELERHFLAVAAEALLHQQDYEQAEALLETALDDLYQRSSVSPWSAPACANLGCCYLHNGDPDKAAVLYQRAADLFTRQRDPESAAQAQRMADDLYAVIEQYRLD